MKKAKKARHPAQMALPEPGGFYGGGFDAPEQAVMEKARSVEGLDDEIALLRTRLKVLVEKDPERLDLCLRAADTIARLVSARHRMTSGQRRSLKEAVTRVISEIAIPIGAAATKAVLNK